jgi:hypothetical protein
VAASEPDIQLPENMEQGIHIVIERQRQAWKRIETRSLQEGL